MDAGDWIAFVSAAVAIGSFIFALAVFRNSSRVLKYQTLAELTREYAKSEMGNHVRRLWDFYKQRNRDPEQVRSVFKNHLKEMDRLQDQSPQLLKEFGGTKLNLARRQVSHFYQRMAVLYKGRLVDPRILYRLWATKDLEIIQEIIIPLEETLLEHHEEPPDTALDDLKALYEDSKNPKWWWRFVY